MRPLPTHGRQTIPITPLLQGNLLLLRRIPLIPLLRNKLRLPLSLLCRKPTRKLLLMLRRRVGVPVIHRTLIPTRPQLLRVPAVERVDAIRSNLAMELLRLKRRDGCLASAIRVARRGSG